MFEDFGGGDSAFDVFAKHLGDQVLEFIGKGLWHVEFAGFYNVDKVADTSSVERHFASHHLVDDHAHAPDVALFAIETANNLWGYVVRGAEGLQLFFWLLLDLGKTEVYQLVFSIIANDDILWLDVSMHNTV